MKRLLKSHYALSCTLMLRYFIKESKENTVGQFIKFLNYMNPRGVGNLLKESWSQQLLKKLELGVYKMWNFNENKYKVLINLPLSKKQKQILYNQG